MGTYSTLVQQQAASANVPFPYNSRSETSLACRWCCPLIMPVLQLACNVAYNTNTVAQSPDQHLLLDISCERLLCIQPCGIILAANASIGAGSACLSCRRSQCACPKACMPNHMWDCMCKHKLTRCTPQALPRVLHQGHGGLLAAAGSPGRPAHPASRRQRSRRSSSSSGSTQRHRALLHRCARRQQRQLQLRLQEHDVPAMIWSGISKLVTASITCRWPWSSAGHSVASHGPTYCQRQQLTAAATAASTVHTPRKMHARKLFCLLSWGGLPPRSQL
jgi:hypothetical protein